MGTGLNAEKKNFLRLGVKPKKGVSNHETRETQEKGTTWPVKFFIYVTGPYKAMRFHPSGQRPSLVISLYFVVSTLLIRMLDKRGETQRLHSLCVHLHFKAFQFWQATG